MTTFRVAHIADIHLCERVRFAGTLRTLEAFCEGVERERADLVIIAGDLVDPRRAPARATPTERNAFMGIVCRLAAHCPVVIVRGNHDAVGDWSFLTSLSTSHRIFYFEEPATLEISDLIEGDARGHRVFVHAVPWLSPSWFADQVASLGLSIDDGYAWISDATKPIFDAIRASTYESPGAIHVGVGHLSVVGGKLANGQALVGHEVQVGAGLLAGLGLHYFGLGHLHERQQVGDGPIWYSGSPNRLDFGEAGKPCSWNLATIDSETRTTTVQAFDLPADRLLCFDGRVIVEEDRKAWVEFDDEAPMLGDEVAGADVRLRIRVPEGAHGEDAIAEVVAFIEQHGGKPVVQRITVAALRSRDGSDEVAAATTTADKVRTYLAQRDHDPKQIERVVQRLEAIEARP